jgi:hypothetical protein
MMLLGWLGFGGALVSAACIALLAALDPKRRGAVPARRGMRRLLAVAAFVPGIVLGIAGRWSDVLIWVGAAAVLGWAIAALASARVKPARSGTESRACPPSRSRDRGACDTRAPH